MEFSKENEQMRKLHRERKAKLAIRDNPKTVAQAIFNILVASSCKGDDKLRAEIEVAVSEVGLPQSGYYSQSELRSAIRDRLKCDDAKGIVKPSVNISLDLKECNDMHARKMVVHVVGSPTDNK